MDYRNRSPLQCKVKLQDKDLWDQFNAVGTEMIITKPGRRMFPSMHVQVEGLDPQKRYCMVLEMAAASKCRYRYTSSTGWSGTGSLEAQSPNRLYIHPDSPASGNHWMAQAVSFGRVKLTNTMNPPRDHLVMHSMHKYQPMIHIIEASSVRMIYDFCPSAMVTFPETQFIAVTAYQNDKMTKMKIDHNPFAKGFRESGQSRCKRKMIRIEKEKRERAEKAENENKESKEDEEGPIIVDDEANPAKRICRSPGMNSSDSGLSDSDCSTSNLSSLTLVTCKQPQSISCYQPAYNVPTYSPVLPPSVVPYMYNSGYYGYSQFYPYLNAYATTYEEAGCASAQDLSMKDKAKVAKQDNVVRDANGKFTDFSIKSLIGCV